MERRALLSARLTMCIQASATRGVSRMLKAFAGTLRLLSAPPLCAASPTTDFGVRAVSGEAALMAEPVTSATRAVTNVVTGGRINISAAASLGSQWGRVTSTWRSRERNRRVGG